MSISRVENETLIMGKEGESVVTPISANIFTRWNKTCYIAHKNPIPDIDEDGNEINTYLKPVKYSINVQQANGYLDVQEFGEKVNEVFKAVVPYNLKTKIKEGDIAYLDGQTPQDEVEGIYGSTGNFIVDSVRPQNLAAVIYFKRLNK